MRAAGVGGFVKQVLIVVFVTWAIAAYPLHAYGSTGLTWALGLGCGICVLNAIGGCLAVAWAFRRPPKVFFSTVFGSMGIRMALIGVAVFGLVRYTDIHVAGFIGALFGYYVVFQVLEIYFLVKRVARLKQGEQEG